MAHSHKKEIVGNKKLVDNIGKNENNYNYMNLSTNDYFKTSDLALAGALNYRGYIIEAIDKQNPKKVEFLFKRDDLIDEIIQSFWTRQLKVEPLAFFNAIKGLKNRIYSE